MNRKNNKVLSITFTGVDYNPGRSKGGSCMKKRYLAIVTVDDKKETTKEYKVPSEKTWRFCRQDVSPERANEIGQEFAEAALTRAHNVKECIKHPFKKEKRETIPTKHHWK